MSRMFRSVNYLTYSGGILTSAPLTFSCWFNCFSGTSGRLFALNAAASANVGFELSGFDTGCKVVTNTNILSSGGGRGFGTWNHGCGRWTSSTSRHSFCNTSSGSNTTSMTPSGVNTTHVGARISSSLRGSYFDGIIADAGLWNVALSDEEVRLLACGASPLLIRPQNLVAFWPLNDFSYGTEYDKNPYKFPKYNLTPAGSLPIDYPVIYTPPSLNRRVVKLFSALQVLATLSGTITSATESDIVAGGKTIILTLSGDTWISAGSFNAQRQAIIDGLTSAQSETFGWNAVPKALQGTGGVVRTSDTVVTITLDAFSTYDIATQETITVTVPGSALTGGNPIVASPTFNISPTANSSGMLLVM